VIGQLGLGFCVRFEKAVLHLWPQTQGFILRKLRRFDGRLVRPMLSDDSGCRNTAATGARRADAAGGKVEDRGSRERAERRTMG
jgi:hypothetical protein